MIYSRNTSEGQFSGTNAEYISFMKRTYESKKGQNAKRQKVSPSMDVLVARKVKSEMAKKTDWHVTDLSQTNIGLSPTAGVVDLTGQLARGDVDLNNFTGNSIFPKWVQVRCQARVVLTETISHTIRLVVGQQIKGSSIPTAANLFQTTGTTHLGAISPFNNDYHEAFKILYDEQIDMNNGGPGATSDCVVSRNIFIPGWKLKKIDFIAANTTPLTGGLFFAYSCNTTATVTPPVINYYTRVKFETS